MLYEYRSDDLECLALMEKMFKSVTEAYANMGIDVEVELLGERPCGVAFGDEYEEFLAPVTEAGKDILGVEFARKSGSTDCNYPLSKGIPAVCIGGCNSVGSHTREEYLDIESLVPGLKFLLGVMNAYYSA